MMVLVAVWMLICYVGLLRQFSSFVCNKISKYTYYLGDKISTEKKNVTGAFMLDGIVNSQLSIYNNGLSREIQSYNGFLSLNPGGNNVLIGTSVNSGYKLDVNGTSRITGALDIQSSYPSLSFLTTSGTNFRFTNRYTDNMFTLDNASVSSELISVLSDGKVGIGTGDPLYKLDVNGTFRTTGEAYLNSTLTVTGTSTLTGLLTANGGIGSTTGTFSSYLTANRFYTGYDSGLANAISCSNWFRSNGATGWLNATYSAGILSDTANIVRTYSTNKFKVYNTAVDSILTLGGVTAANVISSGAVVAGALNGTLPDDLTCATARLIRCKYSGLAGTTNSRRRRIAHKALHISDCECLVQQGVYDYLRDWVIITRLIGCWCLLLIVIFVRLYLHRNVWLVWYRQYLTLQEQRLRGLVTS